MSEPDCGCPKTVTEPYQYTVISVSHEACQFPAALARAEQAEKDLAAMKRIYCDTSKACDALDNENELLEAERDELQERVAELEQFKRWAEAQLEADRDAFKKIIKNHRRSTGVSTP